MSENRRHFSRVKFNARVFLFSDEFRQEAQLIDISLKGALVKIKKEIPLEKGNKCSFEFHLNESDLILTLEAELVYQNADNMGFKFCEMDLDALTHLRRLVELNVGSSEQVQKELFFL